MAVLLITLAAFFCYSFIILSCLSFSWFLKMRSFQQCLWIFCYLFGFLLMIYLSIIFDLYLLIEEFFVVFFNFIVFYQFMVFFDLLNSFFSLSSLYIIPNFIHLTQLKIELLSDQQLQSLHYKSLITNYLKYYSNPANRIYKSQFFNYSVSFKTFLPMQLLQSQDTPSKAQDKPTDNQQNQEAQQNVQQVSKPTSSTIQYGYTRKTHPPLKKKLKINTSHSRGQLRLLKLICKQNDWLEVFKEGDIMWSGLALPQDEWTYATDMKVNRIPAMPHLCHKKTMGFILNKFREYWPDEFYFYPETYLLPEDHKKLEKKIKEGKMLIAKPSAGCQGDGISLIKKLSQIPNTASTQWIVQPYIGNPLLLQKKKFDLRLYVLIASIEPYICFLNQEGLARFCTQDYQQPTNQNFKNAYMHLTNYSLNKNSPKFVNSTQAFGRGSKRCLKVVLQDLAQAGVNIQQLQQKIITLTQKYLTGMFPFLKYYYHATFPKQKGQCFHVLGVDILLDDEMNPWLLQANNNPSFNIQHEVMLPGSLKQVKELSPVDQYVKSVVVEDTLYLVNRKLDKLKEMEIGENFYSYKKILDMQSDDLKDMNIIENMLKIFHSQCSIRSKWVLTSSQFTKLANITGMTNQKITKNDYHLIFIKIMRDKTNPNQMAFQDFIQAIQYIVKEIVGYTKETKLQVMQQHIDFLVAQVEK